MNSVHKGKLYKLIETMPEDMIPVIYKIINLLKMELAPTIKKTGRRGSLAGIWKGSEIDDALYNEAKKSLYPYEN